LCGISYFQIADPKKSISIMVNFTLLLIFFVIALVSELQAQVQPPSITSGVSFQWDGPQPTPFSPANLVSITVDDKVFDQFSLPDRYELTRLGVNGHNQNRFIENGVIIETASDSPTWNSSALAAFSSSNLNFKFESEGNGRNFCSDFDLALTTDAQVQSLYYDNLQIVNQDALIAITTRNGNRCIYIEVIGLEHLGGPETVLARFFARPGPSIFGDAFGPPAVGADYWRSGRVNSNDGNIGVALFKLDDLAPLGSYITGIRYSGASNNHGDGKVFLIRTSSIDLSVEKEVNNPLPNRGDMITITTTATNNGPLDAIGVQVTESLGSGYIVVNANASAGSYNSFTGIWNIGSLAYNQSAVLNIQVIVDETGDYFSTAEITPVLNDPNLENNNASISAKPASVIEANDLGIVTTANNANAGNILSNDFINGDAITISDVNITSVSSSNPSITIDIDSGDIVVGTVPSGIYTIEYTICEEGTGTPNSNCASAVVTVEVQNAIQANEDLIYSVENNPLAGNIFLDNGNGEDLINGEPITIDQINITSVTSPNPLISIDLESGNISVAEVAVGTYTLEYTICENGTDPINSNCSTTTITLVIQQKAIEALDDFLNSAANNPNAGNILQDNGNGEDLLGGEPASIENINITTVIPSNPLVTIDSTTGKVSVGNVNSGLYTIAYTICEVGTDPADSNCSTATVTVEVLNLILASDDTVSSSANNPNAGNVLEDNGNGADTFNGSPATLEQVQITSVTPSDPEVTVDPASGNITVGNISSGPYTITYTMCEVGTDPGDSNCSTATVVVEVKNNIIAKDDTINSTANNPNAGNVLEDNGSGADTFNGVPATLVHVNIASVSPSDTEVTVDPASGIISIGNVSGGSYEIQYTICENGADPSNCATANVTVIVENNVIMIEANDDEVQGVPGTSGIKNVLNVLSNDRLNGALVNPEDVVLLVSGSQVMNPVPFIDSDNNPKPNVVLNSDGSVDVGSNTSSGTYVLVYSVCSASDPGICDAATVTVVVTVSSIVANDDNYGPYNGITGATFGNILENDSINGLAVNPSEVILAYISGNPELILNEDGSITLAPKSPSGEYMLIYSICEVLDPDNCDFAFVTVEAIGEVDLAIEKTSNRIAIWGLEAFDYFIRVSNISVADATNVVVEDLLPEGVVFEAQEVISSLSNIEFNFEEQGNRLVWRLSVLPANASIDIRLSVLAENNNGTRPQVIINNVTVAAEELEVNMSNNMSTAINEINPFFIPNVITPNGNGFNDSFEIVGINKFVKNDLVIFNRYGDHIFQADNYGNNWDAAGQVAGTYFYIFRGEDRQGRKQEFKGWIQVIKN